MDDQRSDEMAVGVSGHINVDMLLGHDIPQLRKHVRKALDAKPQYLCSFTGGWSLVQDCTSHKMIRFYVISM